MNLALWIVTGLLAVLFVTAAAGKLLVPREKLVTHAASAWVEEVSPGALRTIAALELLAVVGLILPAALDVVPVLVPLAAVGLALVMAGAVVMRLRRHEGFRVLNLAYLALAVFVAWGRFGPESFSG